jgi:hypothetical protein
MRNLVVLFIPPGRVEEWRHTLRAGLSVACGYRKIRPLENTEVPIIRETMVATTMNSLFVALFGCAAKPIDFRRGVPINPDEETFERHSVFFLT